MILGMGSIVQQIWPRCKNFSSNDSFSQFAGVGFEQQLAKRTRVKTKFPNPYHPELTVVILPKLDITYDDFTGFRCSQHEPGPWSTIIYDKQFVDVCGSCGVIEESSPLRGRVRPLR